MIGHLQRTARQLVDSRLGSTRTYWRTRFYGATPEEAADPRPFAVVLAERPR